jgi:hypothetical protein
MSQSEVLRTTKKALPIFYSLGCLEEVSLLEQALTDRSVVPNRVQNAKKGYSRCPKEFFEQAG